MSLYSCKLITYRKLRYVDLSQPPQTCQHMLYFQSVEHERESIARSDMLVFFFYLDYDYTEQVNALLISLYYFSKER